MNASNELVASVFIFVTEEDIRFGIWNDCRRCPIARAIRRALNDDSEVMVTALQFDLFQAADDFLIRSFRLPTIAAEFVRRLMASMTVYPIAFELEIPVRFLAPGVAA